MCDVRLLTYLIYYIIYNTHIQRAIQVLTIDTIVPNY